MLWLWPPGEHRVPELLYREFFEEQIGDFAINGARSAAQRGPNGKEMRSKVVGNASHFD